MSSKITAAAAAGALTTIIVWVVNTFVLSPPQLIPGEVGAGITTILTLILGYLIPEKRLTSTG